MLTYVGNYILSGLIENTGIIGARKQPNNQQPTTNQTGQAHVLAMSNVLVNVCVCICGRPIYLFTHSLTHSCYYLPMLLTN